MRCQSVCPVCGRNEKATNATRALFFLLSFSSVHCCAPSHLSATNLVCLWPCVSHSTNLSSVFPFSLIQVMDRLIEFAYTASISVGEKCVIHVMNGAVMYQIDSVVKACCDFLVQQLDPSNAIGIANFAEQIGCTELHQKAREYIYMNFSQVKLLCSILCSPLLYLFLGMFDSWGLSMESGESLICSSGSQLGNTAARWNASPPLAGCHRAVKGLESQQIYETVMKRSCTSWVWQVLCTCKSGGRWVCCKF